MEIITAANQLGSLEHNTVIGSPDLINSRIRFSGEGNILYCEEGVKLKDSKIEFRYSNSVIYLCKPRDTFIINVDIGQGCAIYIGEHLHANKLVELLVSETKTILIGNRCLFSRGIMIRASDAHLVYSAVSHKRVNDTKSVFLGDHVWVGQDVFLLKGTQVGSGSILGARAVVAGKQVPSNTSWAGNPARQISSEPVFYDATCVYSFDEPMLEQYACRETEKYIYKNDKYTISFDEIDHQLSMRKSAQEKLEYLHTIRAYKHHNRFFVAERMPEKQGFFTKIRHH